MTAPEVWRLDAEQAHLTLGPLSASVDISRPGLGLHDLRFNEASLGAAHLLAAQLVGQEATASQVVADHFVRGRDLVVTYAPAHERPVRLQIYWRALDEHEVPGCVAGLDVQVSVQTSLLHAWPALHVRSQLPCSAVAPLPAPSSLANDASASATARCWLCRFASGGVTYAEMVHPADIVREEISHAASATEISRELFGHSLEKGVILRARARGIFIETDGAERVASTAYDRFLAAPLPLTT